MTNLLSDPRWQGVGVIITILAYLLTAYLSRDKILPQRPRWQRVGTIVTIPAILMAIILTANVVPRRFPKMKQLPIFIVATSTGADSAVAAFKGRLRGNGFRVADSRAEAELIIKLSDDPNPFLPKPIPNNPVTNSRRPNRPSVATSGDSG